MSETAEARLKRLAMRSVRRGTKEMDLILGAYAGFRLAAMGEDELRLYDALLAENDQDLYAWVTGAVEAPPRFAGLVARIARQAADAARARGAGAP